MVSVSHPKRSKEAKRVMVHLKSSESSGLAQLSTGEDHEVPCQSSNQLILADISTNRPGTMGPADLQINRAV